MQKPAESADTDAVVGSQQPAAPAEAVPERVEGAAEVVVVRVLPDVVRLDKTFDYAVPDSWHADGRAERLAVGSIVRITLGGRGRRLRGWVTEVGVDPPAGVEVLPLAQMTGMGPPAEILSLAEWAAWRWAGRTVHLLRAASPPRVVTPPGLRSKHSHPGCRFATAP